MNVVSNAVKPINGHGEEKIITLNQYVDKPSKGHVQLKEGDYVTLRVSDNGIGMAAKSELHKPKFLFSCFRCSQ